MSLSTSFASQSTPPPSMRGSYSAAAAAHNQVKKVSLETAYCRILEELERQKKNQAEKDWDFKTLLICSGIFDPQTSEISLELEDGTLLDKEDLSILGQAMGFAKNSYEQIVLAVMELAETDEERLNELVLELN